MNAVYTGSRIATLRKDKGWTQKELVEQLHITDKAVSKWERGLNFPDLALLEPLAAALDTSAADLLGLEDTSAAVLEAVAELHNKEEAKLKKRLLATGCIFMALSLVIFLYLLACGTGPHPSITPQGLLHIVALALFTVSFHALWPFADKTAVFWVGAVKGSRVVTMSGFFVKRPPMPAGMLPKQEEADTPSALLLEDDLPSPEQVKAALSVPGYKLLPALRLLFAVGIVNILLAVISCFGPHWLNIAGASVLLVGTVMLCRAIRSRELLAGAVFGAVNLGLMIIFFFALPSSLPVSGNLIAGIVLVVCGVAHTVCLYRGMADHMNARGFRGEATTAVLAANLTIFLYATSVCLMGYSLYDNPQAWGFGLEAPLLQGALTVVETLRFGMPAAALRAIWTSLQDVLFSNPETILLCIAVAVFAVTALGSGVSFFRKCCRCLNAEAPEG